MKYNHLYVITYKNLIKSLALIPSYRNETIINTLRIWHMVYVYYPRLLKIEMS